MIELRKGSIFNTTAQTIVNPVNTVGVMGSGLALTFKIMFPKMFEKYKKFCREGKFNVGQLWLYKESKYWYVLNFPTKKHYLDFSELAWVDMGLKNLANTYEQRGITSLAIPYLGCGNGELSKEDVYGLINKYLSNINIPVELWEYDPEVGNPIWDKLFTACYSENTVLKRVIRNCGGFPELVKRPGINKDRVGYQINKIIQFEL